MPSTVHALSQSCLDQLVLGQLCGEQRAWGRIKIQGLARIGRVDKADISESWIKCVDISGSGIKSAMRQILS